MEYRGKPEGRPRYVSGPSGPTPCQPYGMAAERLGSPWRIPDFGRKRQDERSVSSILATRPRGGEAYRMAGSRRP